MTGLSFDLTEEQEQLRQTQTSADDPKPSRGLTIFLVDAKSPGLTAMPIPKIGMRSLGSCEVVFDDVFVLAGSAGADLGASLTADELAAGSVTEAPRLSRPAAQAESA